MAEITLEELLKKIGNDLRLYEEDIITKYVLRYKGRDDTLSEFQRGKFNGEMRLLAEKQGVSYEQIENMFVEFFEDHGFSVSGQL